MRKTTPADRWSYRDETGARHVVSSPSEVPPEHRGSAKKHHGKRPLGPYEPNLPKDALIPALLVLVTAIGLLAVWWRTRRSLVGRLALAALLSSLLAGGYWYWAQQRLSEVGTSPSKILQDANRATRRLKQRQREQRRAFEPERR